MPLKRQDIENMIAKCGWLSLDPWLMSILQWQRSVKASRQSRTKLNWSGVTWFICCRVSRSPCVWSIPPLTSTLAAAGFYLSALAYAQLNIGQIKQNGYPSSLYRFCIVTLLTRLFPHKRMSGYCEGNLNHGLANAIGHCDFGSE